MNFLNKSKSDKERDKAYAKGFNLGLALLAKIPVNMQESAHFTIHSLVAENQKNNEYKGLLCGFNTAKMQEMEKRMAQIKALESKSAQTKHLGR